MFWYTDHVCRTILRSLEDWHGGSVSTFDEWFFRRMALTWASQRLQPRLPSIYMHATTLNFTIADRDPTLPERLTVSTIDTSRILPFPTIS